MILKALQLIIVLTVFLLLKYIVWWWTEGQKNYPQWLDYPPFCCRKCLGFWLPISIYVSIWYIFDLPLVAIAGCILTVLDTIAFIINERKKYI